MTQPSRLPQPPRAALDQTLTASLAASLAVVAAQRDGRRAAPLVQHGVHRLGLAGLEALLGGPVLAAEGPEAVQWLRRQGGLDGAGEAPALQSVEPLSPSSAQEADAAAGSARFWSRLTLVSGGAAPSAPAPAALAPLRAWLPDARPQGAAGQDGDTLPLAS